MKILEHYSKFVVGTGFLFLAELVLTITLTEAFAWNFLSAYFLSLMLGSGALVVYNKNVTFGRIKVCKDTHKFQCGVVTFLMYIADILALAIVTPLLNGHYIIAILLITPPFSMLSFYINKQFICHNEIVNKRKKN